MAQPLFFQSDLHFEKQSMETTLPEDPTQWADTILQEVYKQVPYISDFDPHVVLDRADGERGFGFGHVQVQNQTEAQDGESPDALAAAGVREGKIPIVIRDRQLQPLDLLILPSDKVVPLTESRLREALFRPQTFDMTGMSPGDMSMIGQLYPPYRQNFGMGGGGSVMSVGMGKEGSASPVLSAISILIRPADFEAVVQKLASDKSLQAAFASNAAAVPALSTLAAYTPISEEKIAAALLSKQVPTVVQLKKEAQGYSLKEASSALWHPRTTTMDRGQAVALLGGKIVLAADTSGSVTLATGEGVEDREEPEADQPEPITQFGIYKVQDTSGKHLVGYVFSNLVDTDGTALPLALFTNGSEYSIQGDIAGVPVGTGASLFSSRPKGMGVFYYTLPNGRAQATVPMTLNSHVSSAELNHAAWQGETFDGRPVSVVVLPNLQVIAAGPEGELLIPASCSWLSLANSQATKLVEQPEDFTKEGQVQQTLASVLLRSDGASGFSLSGWPLDKIAQEQLQSLSLDDALFYFGGLGTDLDYAQKKLGQATAFGEPVYVVVQRTLEPARAQVAALMKSASVAMAERPYLAAVDLLKEAAVIPDPMAVDTVLSLGFINPENLGVFLSYLPAIDTAQSKMCELLLASRVGLKEVEQGALEKAITATEKVIEGLRVIAFQKG